MESVEHLFGKESLDQIRFQDVSRLIKNQTEESLHLDYEEIPKKNPSFDGLAAHISGFLNTSGGIVIFGVSETRKKGRSVPHMVTWSTLKKENIENSLYSKIDPWAEDIQIHTVQNPKDVSQRIFVILVPQSKNPPHMANNRYYTRLNFQTRPLGHDQVSAIFRQHYLEKYDLVNSVYGPLYNELSSFLSQDRIIEFNVRKFESVSRNGLFLLVEDEELYDMVNSFYLQVMKWNDAIKVCRHRMAQIIHDLASRFFGMKMPSASNSSMIWIEIKAESTWMSPSIDEAVLNEEDPLEFWKKDHPHDRILSTEYYLTYEETIGQNKRFIISENQFQEFASLLKKEMVKDDLINYVRTEFNNLQDLADLLLYTLKIRM